METLYNTNMSLICRIHSSLFHANSQGAQRRGDFTQSGLANLRLCEKLPTHHPITLSASARD